MVGFAGALTQVGLLAMGIPLVSFTFNMGVEAGQRLFIAGIYLFVTVVWWYATRPLTWRPRAIGSIEPMHGFF